MGKSTRSPHRLVFPILLLSVALRSTKEEEDVAGGSASKSLLAMGDELDGMSSPSSASSSSRLSRSFCICVSTLPARDRPNR